MNELQLRGWTVLGSTFVEGTRHHRRRMISVTRDRDPVPTTCPRCSGAGTLRRDGYRPVTVVDAPAFDHQVRWVIHRSRFRCPCGKILLQDLPRYVTRTPGFTARCVLHMRRQAAFKHFNDVAETVGVDESTVRRLVKAAWKEGADRYQPATPRWLGIDEVMLPDRANEDDPYTRSKRAVLVDLETGQLIDLLRDNDLRSIGERIAKFSDPQRIEVVVTDFEQIYRRAARELLPQALVVIDRFHLEEKVSKALDTVRVAEMKDLTKPRFNTPKTRSITRMLRTRKRPKGEGKALFEEFLAHYPNTAAAYQAKEAFKAIWDTAVSPDEAEARFETWAKGLPPSIEPAFASVIKIVRKHARPVFAYFDGRFTNGRTETMNATIRKVVIAGPNHHLETLRAKMLGKARIYVPPARRRKAA